VGRTVLLSGYDPTQRIESGRTLVRKPQ